jgi:Ca-activated chloride channel family protein
MIPFANPLGVWLLGLIPALVVVAFVSRLFLKRAAARWGGTAQLRTMSNLPSQEADILRGACLWGALVLTALSFARPQWGEVAETVQRVGLDTVILLDTSRSMAVRDADPSRLERVKLEVRYLLTATEGNRTGLVDFAGVPVVLSPLTEDAEAIGMLLEISDPDLVPALGTDIGKAIAEAIRLFPPTRDRDQVVVLFSDGEDQGKDALAAARTAARVGIRVFCVGVGTASGGPVPGPAGRPMTDPTTGAPARSRLDEAALSQIASFTDGRYWTLAGAGSVVPQIVEEMGRLKRKEYASRSQAMRQDQFAVFIWPALILLGLAMTIPDRRMVPGTAAGVPPRKRKTFGLAGLTLLGGLLSSSAGSVYGQSVYSLSESARAECAKGQWAAALPLYQKALQKAEPSSVKPLLHYNTGTCFLALGKAPEARDELTLALPGASSDLKDRALYNLSQAFYAGGDRDRALGVLRTLIEDEPENRNAALLYEWILRQSPPDQPPPQDHPPQQPPPPPPPDVLEQLPMPPPKELRDQMRPPQQPLPWMKPW